MGGLDVNTHIGFFEIVPDRSRASLLLLIEEKIAPGNTITLVNSDTWSAYRNAINAIPVIPPFNHLSVNHRENFVDPQTGACTNHIERWWREVKQKMKRMCGMSEEALPGYLDEFLWRQLRGKTPDEAFDNILNDIWEWYPVP